MDKASRTRSGMFFTTLEENRFSRFCSGSGCCVVLQVLITQFLWTDQLGRLLVKRFDRREFHEITFHLVNGHQFLGSWYLCIHLFDAGAYLHRLVAEWKGECLVYRIICHLLDFLNRYQVFASLTGIQMPEAASSKASYSCIVAAITIQVVGSPSQWFC